MIELLPDSEIVPDKYLGMDPKHRHYYQVDEYAYRIENNCLVQVCLMSAWPNTVPTFNVEKDLPLTYCYANQAWVGNGFILKCRHRDKSPTCYACNHIGEKHGCSHDH